MFFAAIALRYAFPISVYLSEGVVNSAGRSVTMQSISSSLKVGNKIPLLDNAFYLGALSKRENGKKTSRKCLKINKFSGNHEPKGHHDRRNP